MKPIRQPEDVARAPAAKGTPGEHGKPAEDEGAISANSPPADTRAARPTPLRAARTTATNSSAAAAARRPRLLFTLIEVAEIARAPLSTVRHWIQCGRLRTRKPGRHVLVARADLAAFLEVSPDDLS